MDRLVPEVETVQQIRAAARFRGGSALIDPVETLHFEEGFAQLVRQALGHYWGGPRLTRSPLLSLKVVRTAVEQKGWMIELAEITMIPKDTVKLEGKKAEQMLRMMDALDDNEDMQKVFANFDISEEEMMKQSA